MRNHNKSKAFQLSDSLALMVYKICAQLPAEERFGLAAQMRRAAVSIACNIVEGCARHTGADFLRFLDIAYGSARELEYQASLAFRLGYIDVKSNQELSAACEETSKVLNGLIRSLRQQ